LGWDDIDSSEAADGGGGSGTVIGVILGIIVLAAVILGIYMWRASQKDDADLAGIQQRAKAAATHENPMYETGPDMAAKDISGAAEMQNPLAMAKKAATAAAAGGGGDAKQSGANGYIFTKNDIGKRVEVLGFEGTGGSIRFVGVHHETYKPRIGVEMDDPVGKHNGTMKGHKYFACKSKCGVITVPKKVTIVAAADTGGGGGYLSVGADDDGDVVC